MSTASQLTEKSVSTSFRVRYFTAKGQREFVFHHVLSIDLLLLLVMQETCTLLSKLEMTL